MQSQWEPWDCFPATRWSHLGVMGDSDTWIVLCISSLPHSLVLVAVTAKTLPHKDMFLEMEEELSVFLWQGQDILLWL